MSLAYMAALHPDILWVVLMMGNAKKKPIVTIIAGNKRFRNVRQCNETEGLPTWKKFWLS